MWVPHKELKKKKEDDKTKKTSNEDGRAESEFRRDFFFYYLFSLNFFLRFTETCPSEFVGINTESALRDEGYA